MPGPLESADAGGGPGRSRPADPVAVGLVALFVTALVTAQVTAAKLIAVPLRLPAVGGVDLPAVGSELVLPGAALAYALTFLASDCYAELYGRRPAQVVVNVAFLMNGVLLALVWTTILAPAAGGVDPGAFRSVLGASTNVVAGSLVAYLVSQNWDVVAFHWLRARTGGRHLWLRNVGSTATSQALDTAIFVGIAFGIAPRVAGVGPALALGALGQLMLGQYLLKLAIAVLDTPVVYAVVGVVRRRRDGAAGAGGLAP
jgi:uncharacterized integral membrane protein (TIGR00697 family)